MPVSRDLDDDLPAASRPRLAPRSRVVIDAAVPLPGIACSAFSMTLVSARANSVRSIVDRRQVRPAPATSIAMRCARPLRYGSTTSSISAGSVVGSGRGVGDDAKLENSAEICRSSLTCDRIAVDAFVEHRRQRPAAIEVDALRVLGRQLNRRQRVLDVVRDLPRHVGPGFEPLRALELAALALQVGGHLVEVLDQPPQLVRRGGRDARVEIAARDAPRRARQPVHRIGDPLGHPVAERRAEQAEQHEAGQHAAIELVDLLLDLLLRGSSSAP